MSSNLNVSRNATVQGAMHVAGNATVASNLTVLGNASVSNNALIQGVLTVSGNANMSNVNVSRNANISRQVFVGETLYVVGNATMATNLQASNAFLTNLTVSGNTNFANVNISKALYVSGDTTMSANLRVLGNANIAKNATVAGEVLTFGNLTATQNVYAQNTVYATNYDGVPTINAGSLNSDFTMGLSVPGLTSRIIKIGNFLQSGTVNNIFIGGGQDVIVMGGTIINNQNIKAGSILYLNTPIYTNGVLVGTNSGMGNLVGVNSSVGSGIVIGENGNSSAGYISVPGDKSGFLFRPTDPDNTNILKFDVKNSSLPNTYSSGLMMLMPSAASSDSTYTMVSGQIDPSNILLGNKYLATSSSPQVIDSSFSIFGHMSIGSYPAYSQSQCSLEIQGNVYHTNGLIWQF
jgi:hypothetical protein